MVVIEPFSPPAVALLPVIVNAGRLDADRTALDIQVSLVASAKAKFVPSSYLQENAAPVVLRVNDCWVHVDIEKLSPSCNYYAFGDKRVSVLDYRHDPVGTPTWPAYGPYSALLLMDQSQRTAAYDLDDLRIRAAMRFITRAGTGPEADLIAVAGFAGSSAGAPSPALLPRLPLWAPPGATTLFSDDRLAQAAAVETLQPLVGGNAPVLEALSASLSLAGAQPPGTHRRGIVAMLGGGDDSSLTELQRKDALESLRQLQVDTGVQVILVVGRLDEDETDERRQLAELATALRAPVIYVNSRGLYYAMDLAADLLTGLPLPSVNATFRMTSDQPGGFQAGAALHGTVWIESNLCGVGCMEVPYQFAVEIP